MTAQATEQKVIGAKQVKERDPNLLDDSKPYTRYKDATECYFVQGNKVFSNSGMVLLGPESSKVDIWNIQQKPIGKMAIERAGITVQQVEAVEEARGTDVFPCTVCGKSFRSPQGLAVHNHACHSTPKGKK